MEEEQNRLAEQQNEDDNAGDSETDDNDAGDSETDDETDDEDDYGPSPAAGVWAGSKKLQAESEALLDDGEDDESRPNKKLRSD